MISVLVLTNPVVAGPEAAYIGKPQPLVQLPDSSGKIRNIQDWKGRVLIVNFWATWCAPCRTEIPMFNRLQQDYGSSKIQFIGIAIDNKPAVSKFMVTQKFQYPVLIGDLEAVAIAEDYGNEQGVMPYTVFVDTQGNIAAIALGALTEQATRKYIDRLLQGMK